MPVHITTQRLAVLFVAISAFLFAIKAVVIKHAYASAAHMGVSLNGETLLAIRMASCLPLFMLMAYLSPKPSSPINYKHWGLLWVAGFLGYYLASILDFIGLEYISASLERVILFLYPTLTVVMTAFFYKKPLSPFQIGCIVLSYGGTLLVMLGGDSSVALPATTTLFWGGLLVFLAALAYASYLVLSPQLIGVFGSMRFTGLAISIASIAAILHFLLITPQPIAHLAQLPTSLWGWGIFLGIFATFIPATLLIQGIKHIGASTSALISAAGPIITVLIAVQWLGEHLNLWQWLGCLLNIAGVVAIGIRQSSAAQKNDAGSSTTA